MPHDSFGQALLVLLVPHSHLASFISISSLLGLGMVIGIVHARRSADEKKIASALAHAIRDRVV